jgi:dephospho-CoA kinase
MTAVWYYGIMAVRKMTFSLPEDVAARFLKRVAARDRSRYVAAALAEKLSQREKRLIRACDIVNSDSAVREIEEEFEALNDQIAEPWDHAPTR